MQVFDTIIIGAGPGGLSCAATLAGLGQDVLVLERNSRVGPKVCAGGVPKSSFTGEVPEKIIERSFNKHCILSNWQKVTISSAAPIIYTVSREKLGQWMLEQALAAGATIQTRAPVVRITSASVITKEGRFGYRHLVGADGSSSIVRRHLGIATSHTGTGINYQVPGNFDNLEWHLNASLFHNGYAWVFPYKGSASIGAYACNTLYQPRVLLQKMHQWAQKYGIDLDQTKPRAALINYDYRGWRFGNTFLVGDAAGLASGLTGEGIYPAILSGKTVAHVIMNDRYDCSALERLIRKQRIHRQMLGLTSQNKLFSKLLLEFLLFWLRPGMVPYRALEMGA